MYIMGFKKKLLNRCLPTSIICVLFYICIYIRQEFRAEWNSCYIDHFCLLTGVKQGRVLSAILFTLSIDNFFFKYVGIEVVVLIIVAQEQTPTLMTLPYFVFAFLDLLVC